MGASGVAALPGSHLLLGAVALAWVVGVGAGMKALYDHSGTAGDAARAPEAWPARSILERDPKLPTLVMLAHPRCPCTRASLGELSVLMTRARGRLRAHVLFIEPVGTKPGFSRAELWETAAAIPGVEVHADPEGHLAESFGARTSGQVLLYGADGRLWFAGGITGSRAHQGDNAGLDRVLSLLRSGRADRTESSVFGCSLFEKKEER